jgi:hypothetical protein
MTTRTRKPPATGPFAEALAAGNKVGAANATDAQVMAMFCYDTLQIVVGAFSPQLVWEGAQKAGLTSLELLKLCNDRDLDALDDLQWS